MWHKILLKVANPRIMLPTPKQVKPLRMFEVAMNLEDLKKAGPRVERAVKTYGRKRQAIAA